MVDLFYDGYTMREVSLPHPNSKIELIGYPRDFFPVLKGLAYLCYPSYFVLS